MKRCLGLILAVALGLAACTPAESATSGATIRIASAEPVGILNPWDFLGQFHAMDLLYESLVAYGQGGELEPSLATSWDTSADGRTVTFQLRDDVVFHDGTPFDAEAAKFNFEQWVGRDGFSFLGSSNAITDIDAAGPHTLVLTLSEPYPPLLQELTIVRPFRFVSPASAPDGEYSEPMGTGPWKLESATETTGSFVRNEDYSGPLPPLERVELKVIPDSQTRLAALRSGEVDLIGGGYLSPINTVEAAELAEDPSFTLLTGEADTAMSLTFNQDGILGEQAVREAVSLATDVEAINRVLYGGTEHVARGFFPPVGAPQRHSRRAEARSGAGGGGAARGRLAG